MTEVLVQIRYASITVDDQERALRFYTDVLGFTKVADVPLGEHRWLTVASPDGPEGVELVLEPLAFPPAREYQKALFEAGIPATAFVTSDIHGDVERLTAAGVAFRGEPVDAGTVTVVAFEDTCGNLIQLVQPAA
jgi:catechol 2,3-dioxygenase-like lactoylglutathione lyase family enzyme